MGLSVSQRLPPLNSYSTQWLDHPLTLLILSFATFSCIHLESPIKCLAPWGQYHHVHLNLRFKAFPLNLRFAIPTTCCLIRIQIQQSKNETPYVPPQKMCSVSGTPFSESCIYLFYKYLFVLTNTCTYDGPGTWWWMEQMCFHDACLKPVEPRKAPVTYNLKAVHSWRFSLPR